MNYYLVTGTSYECCPYGGTMVKLFAIFNTKTKAESYVKAKNDKIKCDLTDEDEKWSNYHLSISKFTNGKSIYLYGDFGE